jgi:hypothetical protein
LGGHGICGVRWKGSPVDRLDRELFSQGVRVTKSFVDKEFVEVVRRTGSWVDMTWVNSLDRELMS